MVTCGPFIIHLCACSCFYYIPQVLLLMIFGNTVTAHNVYAEYSKKYILQSTCLLATLELLAGVCPGSVFVLLIQHSVQDFFFKVPPFHFYCSLLLCCWELHSKGGCLEMQSSCQRQWLVVGCHGDWRSRQSVVSSSLACREIAVSCGFRGML